jgi:hypothetical protein
MTPDERAKSREIKRSNKNRSFKDYTYSAKENTATLKDSYEFKDSSTHGIGTFATKDINENDMVGLYYLNLLREQMTPQFQRTDFCRFTNHSQHIPNIVLKKEFDGNFYTHATREIQEGEELLIDYFDVYEQIMPSLGTHGEVIPEVLRWTEGYGDMVIPPDGFGDLRDELAHFTEINEEVDTITGELDEREVRHNISRKPSKKRYKTGDDSYVDTELARLLGTPQPNPRPKPKPKHPAGDHPGLDPDLVLDSVESIRFDEGKIRDTIDTFKFYFKPVEVEKRKRRREEKKEVKKYNKMIGIKSEEVQLDKDTELEELGRPTLKPYIPAAEANIEKLRSQISSFELGGGKMPPGGVKYSRAIISKRQQGIKRAKEKLGESHVELEESYDNKGLLKIGLTHAVYSRGPSGQIHFTTRRKKTANFKAKMYTDAIQFNQKDHPGFGVMIVPHGTPNGKSVHKDHEKYYGKADESVELEERKYFPGPKLKEGAGDASASASETDANRAAYLKQYGAKPEQRERRSARTNARNKLIRSGRASVGDGKDLDHKDGNPLNNSPKNLRMVGRSFNRGRDNNKWRTNEEHGAGEIGTDKLLKRYIKDTPFMKILKNRK